MAKKQSEKQIAIQHLKEIIGNAMRNGKSREATDAIKTLAQMKGWTRGDEESTNTIILDLNKLPKTTSVAIGNAHAPEEKERLMKLEAFYERHYGKKD